MQRRTLIDPFEITPYVSPAPALPPRVGQRTRQPDRDARRTLPDPFEARPSQAYRPKQITLLDPFDRGRKP